MKFKRFSILYYLLLVVALLGCSVSKKTGSSHSDAYIQISSLKFLDEYIIPFNSHFGNTWVGGLSGIDYDPKQNLYYLISDERSATTASRFYTASIDITNNKIDSIRFLSVASLRNERNDTFPSFKLDPQNAADPESIRFNKNTQTLVWSSEGDKANRNGNLVTQNPAIYEMGLSGNYLNSFLLPANIKMNIENKGARENSTLEGLSFSNDYKYLWASMEGPIYEDGPLSSPVYAGAPVRFTKFDANRKNVVGQYAYKLDAVAREPKPIDAFNVNGVSEMLNIGDNRFLVLERSFSSGYLNCNIKIYLADFSKATDISNNYGLHKNKTYKPATKKLILNMDSLNRQVDNVEGITLGPLLQNGHRSLILIVDNNFKILEPSQVFLFEIIP